MAYTTLAKMAVIPPFLNSLIGLHAFNARKGHGSFVMFELTASPESPEEKAYFRIDMCAWRISEAGKELAHSESSGAEIKGAVSALNGRRLEGITLHEFIAQHRVSHGASLIFQDHLTFKLQQYDPGKAEDAIFVSRNAARVT